MRIVLFVLLIIIATIIGGLYGALHDQITYTVCDEFFTKMRFHEYGIQSDANSDVNNRWEAAKIGWKNTWHVGLGLGIVLALAGLIHSDNKTMFTVTLKGFMLAMLTGFFFGMIAFLFTESSIDIATSQNVVDKVSFNRVIRMNNYSYVGGIIGMFLALGWITLNSRKNIQK
jgi:hypothetical protein